MRIAKHFAALAALGLLAAGQPVLAKNDKVPGGDPCGNGPGQGTHNPCNGNNGNQGNNGNAGEQVDYDHDPDPFTIERPGNDSGAFIHQVGERGEASIAQQSNTQYAHVDQDGDDNLATVAQQGSGAHYALIGQEGDYNELDLLQEGSAEQVAFLDQAGSGNALSVWQQGSLESNGVLARQLGSGNELSLTQQGDGNQAMLLQDGSDNAMTATQLGDNNQLQWTQAGDNLSDLQITQNGGQAMQVTQSR